MNKFETKYGYFSEQGDEFIIKTYQTPKPWINVITNGDYGLTISQCGGGFSWLTHSEFNRVTRWHQDLIQDNWGKYIYIRNNKTGEFWNPYFLPSKNKLDKYQCIHSFGYTKFISEKNGIQTELTIFVPNNDSLELWHLTLKNNTSEKLDLSLFTYFEWCLGSSSDHHREFHKTFIQTEFNEKDNAMYATKRLWEIPLGDRGHWNIDYQYWGFLSANKKITSYEGEKENFLGLYGDLINPKAVVENNLTNKTGAWTDPIGSVKVDITLEPDSDDSVCFYLGLEKDKNKIKHILNKYKTEDKIEKELKAVKERWKNLLGTLEINTPDEGMNLLVNKWLRYQAIAGRLWGRTAYYQQSGAFGFRDQLQDSLVFLPIDPEYTANQIRLHSKHQFEDGQVLHWWHPISETGLQTNMTDDLLWLPFVLIQYYKETNDLNIFYEATEYYDNKEKKESLYKHCVKAIEKVFTRFSERGLPLIGAGDWNDGLSAVGLDMKGESIWLAEFFYYILDEFALISEKLNDNKNVTIFNEKRDELKVAFDKYAWDGNWFYRATKDNGEKIGSKENIEGKIYLNTQTWSIISGIADTENGLKAMESVKKYLLKKNGPLLLSPAYSKPDKYIGYLSRYAAGKRENGGVYTHAAVWSIWAYSLLDESETVYDIFKKLAPIYNGMNPDEYSAEPYVTPGNIDGPDSPDYGKGGWTWYSGSASWFQKVCVDWILGVRSIEEGLLIDPCIPTEWKHFSVKRLFRGKKINIDFINEHGASTGIKSLVINGKEAKGNIIHTEDIEEDSINVIVTMS